jgi:signal transduction histidine kinase
MPSRPVELVRNDNMLRVHIRADLGRRAGLAAPIVGAEEQVYSQYLHNFRTQNTGALAVLILSLLVGLMALALWATQVDATAQGRRGRDPLYLMAGVAALCWSVSVANFIIEEPPLPWPWWGMVATFSTAVWACSMALFCVEVAGWRRALAVTWLRRWLAGLLVACGVAVVAGLVYGYAAVLTPWFVAFGMVLLVIVLMRFRSASGLAHDLLANMAARVAAKEQELAQSYQRLELLAREQERNSERTRILRDMHDGVGSHISSAIRQLESGRATPEQVQHTLRNSLDQLKLSIDTMHLPTGDITALLANLRYRLEPRFKALDMELQWGVDLLAPMERLDDKAMRHLQYMVFEAVSNVLQHAHATVLRIELRAGTGVLAGNRQRPWV